jgi:hypothetical protein
MAEEKNNNLARKTKKLSEEGGKKSNLALKVKFSKKLMTNSEEEFFLLSPNKLFRFVSLE